MKTLTLTLLVSICLFLVSFDLYIKKGDKNAPLENTEYYSIGYTMPSLVMYEAIEKYSEKYGIPRRIAYGVAFKETRYQGPFHWKYDPKQISPVGALGPMQIMPSTADMMWRGTKINRSRLRDDIDFNVHTSMKLLKHLHKTYGSWSIALGCYNTGKPIANQYAIDVINFNFQGYGFRNNGSQ